MYSPYIHMHTCIYTATKPLPPRVHNIAILCTYPKGPDSSGWADVSAMDTTLQPRHHQNQSDYLKHQQPLLYHIRLHHNTYIQYCMHHYHCDRTMQNQYRLTVHCVNFNILKIRGIRITYMFCTDKNNIKSDNNQKCHHKPLCWVM